MGEIGAVVGAKSSNVQAEVPDEVDEHELQPGLEAHGAELGEKLPARRHLHGLDAPAQAFVLLEQRDMKAVAPQQVRGVEAADTAADDGDDRAFG